MKIGEPFTREIIVVPVHEVSEADLLEILTAFRDTEVAVEDIYYHMDLEISHELRRAVNAIRDGSIVSRIQFIEGNG